MEGYRHVTTQEVIFRDIDFFHHANNAAYSTWSETARMAYMRDVCGVERLEEMSIVLGTIKISFRSSALYQEMLTVGTRMARLGTKSFDLDHEIRGADGRLVAVVETTQVCYDHTQRQTIPVPAEWRRRMEEYEGD
jgi:acyl-CoA thioester hydrolase